MAHAAPPVVRAAIQPSIATAPKPATVETAPPMRRHAVELRHVTKSFGSHVAVRDLSLSVPERTICGFLGPNGSGKTTTLRLIMRIYQPDEGAGLVRVLGDETTQSPTDRVGYLPEERGLYRRMKVRDILRFYAELKGCTDMRGAVDEWLERMRLTAAAGKRIESLSKGMAQKVQFIAAVINRPQLLVLDEPFSGLDPVNGEVLRRAILELNREGTSIIYSTHDMHTAEKMCDCIVMLCDGSKVLDGTLQSIQDQYGADTIRVRLAEQHVRLDDLQDVAEVCDFGRQQELRMKPGYNAKAVLHAIMDRATVMQFEVCNPSLHDIFVRLAEPAGRERSHA